MRLKLISCEIFEREVQAAVARSSNQIDTQFLSKAPHQLSPAETVQCFQTIIDQADRASYHGVLLVVGSCKPGLAGLQARSIPVVVPRAKDCISLVLERANPACQPRVKAHAGSDSLFRTPHQQPAPILTGSWLAPLATPSARRTRTAASDLANGRARFRLPSRAGPVKGCCARTQCSVLDLLVNGFWNYNDCLVVPPGWRLVAGHDQGSIAAEELPL